MKRKIYPITTDHDKGQGMRELEMTRPADWTLCTKECKLAMQCLDPSDCQASINHEPNSQSH